MALDRTLRTLALAAVLAAPTWARADEMRPPFFDQIYESLPLDGPDAALPADLWQVPPPDWLWTRADNLSPGEAANPNASLMPDFDGWAEGAIPPFGEWVADLPAFLFSPGTAPLTEPASVLPPFFAETDTPPFGDWFAELPAFLAPAGATAPDLAGADLPPFFAETQTPPLSDWSAVPPAFLMAREATERPTIPDLPSFDTTALAARPIGNAAALLPAFLAETALVGVAATPLAPPAPGLPPFDSAAVAAPPIPGLAAAPCVAGVAYGRFHFPTGSARLDPAALQQITTVANRLKSCPDLRVLVSGHTDNVGRDEKNMVLARRRALAILNALERSGVAGHRLEWVSNGPSMPIASNDTAEGRALNRRIDVTVR